MKFDVEDNDFQTGSFNIPSTMGGFIVDDILKFRGFAIKMLQIQIAPVIYGIILLSILKILVTIIQT
jgi:hypothetical protein